MQKFVAILRPPNSPIVLPPRTIELRPSVLYILPEGSTEDRPSFGLILTTGDSTPVVVAQISFKMLFDSLNTEAKELLEKEWATMKGGA